MDQILESEQEFAPVAGIDWLSLGTTRRVLALEYVAVDLDVLLQISRHVLFGKNRRHRTFRLAGPAIDALVGMDEQLLGTLVNAIHRTHVDARAILGVLAGFRYDVRHLDPGSAMSAACRSPRAEVVPLRKIDPQS
jgi:hypothetical protein